MPCQRRRTERFGVGDEPGVKPVPKSRARATDTYSRIVLQ